MDASSTKRSRRAQEADGRQVVEADLTWMGTCFEENVRVVVSADGRIEAVGKQLSAETTLRLRGRALLPGFVNAHSHAFQRGLRGRGETYPASAGVNSFWTWRQEMYSLVASLDEGRFYTLSKQCFEEMRASGITTVGEFHYFHHDVSEAGFAFDEVVIRAARDAGLRIVLLNAFYEFGGFEGAPLNASQRRFQTGSWEAFWANMDRLATMTSAARGEALGVVAHSMRAVDVPTIKRLHDEATRRGMVFHMHIEEQPKEIEDCRAALGAAPMAVLTRRLAIDDRFTAVHCTHTAAEDLREFERAGGNVCICPCTEGNLGDGLFEHLGVCGGRVCLGTDCNARIDMIEEMRWLEYGQRTRKLHRGVMSAASGTEDVSASLLRCATVHGARALGVAAGAIEAGKWADFAVVDLSKPSLAGWHAESLLPSVLFGCSAEAIICATCVGGHWHGLRDVDE